MYWLNTKLRALLALLPFFFLGLLLYWHQNVSLALLAWIGGGCLVVGTYRVVSMGVDYLDGWADYLYWHPRRERQARESATATELQDLERR